MKETYTTPEITIIELEGEQLMLTISAEGEDGLEGTTYGNVGSGLDADAKGRRGAWGDLWN